MAGRCWIWRGADDVGGVVRFLVSEVLLQEMQGSHTRLRGGISMGQRAWRYGSDDFGSEPERVGKPPASQPVSAQEARRLMKSLTQTSFVLPEGRVVGIRSPVVINLLAERGAPGICCKSEVPLVIGRTEGIKV